MSRAVRFTKAEMANAAKISREQLVVVKLTREGDMLVFPDLNSLPKGGKRVDEEEDFLL